MRLAARVKPAYGPTLPDLAEARFGALPRSARRTIAAVPLLLVAVIALLAVRGGSTVASGTAGGVHFSFRYTGLRREPAAPGQALVLAGHKGGRLAARIVIAPLRLPAYQGDATGIEPLVATNMMRALAAHTHGIRLENTGPTIVGGVAGYDFTYEREISGQTYFGRVILITPSIAGGGREGLILSLLAEPVLAGIVAAGKSELAGALYEPGQGGVGVLFQPSGLLSEPLATLRISG